MDDFAFINAVEDGPRTWKSALLGPARRVARRVLRPIFFRQAELMTRLAARLDDADQEMRDLRARQDRAEDLARETIAFGWDYVAMTRRLAALEDRLEAIESGAASLHIRRRMPTPPRAEAG